MINDLIFRDNPLILVAIVLVALTLAIELPYRYGKALVREMHAKDEAWNTIYAGLLALIAFMLGLSYVQAQGRFDVRRQLVVTEANAIGTTWLRADQLPPPKAAKFRAILTDYASIRLQAYTRPRDVALLSRAIEQSDADQAKLWDIASGALRAHPNNLGLSLLMQTLNDTIDLSAEQYAALTQHIPTSVIILTLILVLMGAVFTGFSFARVQARPAVFSAIYVVALTLVLQMVIDFDRPRTGFVHVSLDPLRMQVQAMRR
ncbi:MAG: bestrophin-like domain [Vulcanimicrobiaceae bacterium]